MTLPHIKWIELILLEYLPFKSKFFFIIFPYLYVFRNYQSWLFVFQAKRRNLTKNTSREHSVPKNPEQGKKCTLLEKKNQSVVTLEIRGRTSTSTITAV